VSGTDTPLLIPPPTEPDATVAPYLPTAVTSWVGRQK